MKSTDLRVKVDSRHFELYNDFAQAGVGSEAHSLFFAAACVGFRNNQRRKLSPGRDKFWSHTFSVDEWACMHTMALTTWDNRFDKLQDDKEVISLIEEFATAGLDLLIENDLSDYMLKSTKESRLDTGASRDLVQVLLMSLWQMSGDNLVG